jgi:acyl-coenzyme A synthetase/AMP-(fatty) acid ligase
MGWRLKLQSLVLTGQIKSNDTVICHSAGMVAQVRAWLAAHSLGMVKIVVKP